MAKQSLAEVARVARCEVKAAKGLILQVRHKHWVFRRYQATLCCQHLVFD